MRENLHTVDISSSSHLSCLVNIVFECLLAQKMLNGQKCCLGNSLVLKTSPNIYRLLNSSSQNWKWSHFYPTPSIFWCLWWQFEKSTLFGIIYKKISTLCTISFLWYQDIINQRSRLISNAWANNIDSPRKQLDVNQTFSTCVVHVLT